MADRPGPPAAARREPPAPVLVLGGSGFVGGALLAGLLERGGQVRALARTPAAAEKLERLGALPVTGDLLDPAGLVAAMAGCAVVYHAAGVNAFCLPDPERMFRVNVAGSVNVVRAAAEAGVGRLVYTSSAATLGEAHGSVGNEQSAHRGWYLSAYERSKHEAERRVLDAAARSGVDVVCVNPSSVQGPGRTHGTAKLLLQYVNGRLRYLVDTRTSYLDVADCTAGHLLATEHGHPGERYVLSGGTLPIRDLLAVVGRVTGVEHPVRWLPPTAARAAAAVVGAGFRLARRKAPICRELMRTLLHGHRYDGSRATRELGLAYTPLEETIRRTLDWYAEHGYLTRSATGGPPGPVR